MIENINQLTSYEKNAILMSHTGNLNLNSFAAEVEFHADAIDNVEIYAEYFNNFFLFDSNIVDELFVGWYYEQAIRSDMGLGEETQSGFVDQYYDLESDMVVAQAKIHGYQ